MTTPIDGHGWVALAALLVTTWYRALKDDVTVFPDLSPTWRALLVSLAGIAAGAFEQATNGGNIVNALVVALITAGPALAHLIVDIVRGPKVPAS